MPKEEKPVEKTEKKVEKMEDESKESTELQTHILENARYLTEVLGNDLARNTKYSEKNHYLSKEELLNLALSDTTYWA